MPKAYEERRRERRSRVRSRQAHQVARGPHEPPRRGRRHRRLRRPCSIWPPWATRSRFSSPAPTAWAPSSWSPSWPISTAPSASTAWPCASTTSPPRAPSRCSSLTTSPAAKNDPAPLEQVVAGNGRRLCTGRFRAGRRRNRRNAGHVRRRRIRSRRILGRRCPKSPPSWTVPPSLKATCSSACPPPAYTQWLLPWCAKALFEQAGYTVDTELDELGGESSATCCSPTKIYVKALSPVQGGRSQGRGSTSPAAASSRTSRA